MLWFYDGQIRRYLTQTIRVFSNFTVKYGDGTLVRIPVMYGDADRQVASIIRNNSENKVNSVPRISVYVTGLELDTSRLSDATYVGKMNFRERDFNVDGSGNPTNYNEAQGRNYTVERLMPTPFKLTMKVDIWSANTDQKLQILEQILVLFNPSLELQTTDNYIDWTSISVLNLTNISWDSRTVPVGTDTPIDIATLTVESPIWIGPPVKVKRLGVIQKIITSLYGASDTSTSSGYIEGLGVDLAGSPGPTTFSDLLTRINVTVTDYGVQVYNGQAILLNASESVVPREPTFDIPVRQGTPVLWDNVFNQYPDKFFPGSSRIYLLQSNGSEIVGTISLNPTDHTLLMINWDPDTLTTNTGIDSAGNFDYEVGYTAPAYRNGQAGSQGSPGTFDAIINPQTTGPDDAKLHTKYGSLVGGRRYLITENIGDAQTITDGNQSITWGNLIAHANDIIEYTGSAWRVIFDSTQDYSSTFAQTNIYTGVQFTWNNVSWIKSFEGEYQAGTWRLEL